MTLGENGYFEFLGRRDDMVKSRGYRIELGEIESALYGRPAAKETAVIAICSCGNVPVSRRRTSISS